MTCTRYLFGLLFLMSLVKGRDMNAQNMGRLNTTGTSVVQSQWRRPIISPVRCDQDDNLYIREYVPGTSNITVTIVSSKGDKVTETSFAADSNLTKGKLQDFGLRPNGELHELVSVGRSAYLVDFKRDGSLAGTTKLQKEFWPAKLALGEASGALFLVSGSEMPVPGEPPKVFNGLFDTSGNLVRELKFSGDPGQIKPEKQKPGGDKNYYEDKASFPLQLGTAEADLNGNFYLIRASQPPVAFVLNASGDFVRKLQIKSPDPGMRLLAAHVITGRLAALFGQTEADGQITRKVMTVVDTSNGNTMQQYSVPSDLGSAFACYSGDDFGFVTTRDNKLAILHARPE